MENNFPNVKIVKKKVCMTEVIIRWTPWQTYDFILIQ